MLLSRLRFRICSKGQLLRDTSGLPPDYDTPEFSDSTEAARHYTPQAFAEKFCQQNLASDPGTPWNYSNCGYDLLGLILERVTGHRFEDLLRERLLDPLYAAPIPRPEPCIFNNRAYGWFVNKPVAEMRGDLPGSYFSWIIRLPKRDAVIVTLRKAITYSIE